MPRMPRPQQKASTSEPMPVHSAAVALPLVRCGSRVAVRLPVLRLAVAAAGRRAEPYGCWP